MISYQIVCGAVVMLPLIHHDLLDAIIRLLICRFQKSHLMFKMI